MEVVKIGLTMHLFSAANNFLVQPDVSVADSSTYVPAYLCCILSKNMHAIYQEHLSSFPRGLALLLLSNVINYSYVML